MAGDTELAREIDETRVDPAFARAKQSDQAMYAVKGAGNGSAVAFRG